MKSCTAPLHALSWMFAGCRRTWQFGNKFVTKATPIACFIIQAGWVVNNNRLINVATPFSLHFAHTHRPSALNNKCHFLIGWATFNIPQLTHTHTHVSYHTTVHCSHLLPFPRHSLFPHLIDNFSWSFSLSHWDQSGCHTHHQWRTVQEHLPTLYYSTMDDERVYTRGWDDTVTRQMQ